MESVIKMAMLVTAAMLLLLPGATALTYEVGGPLGWTIPPDGPNTDYYDVWASGYTFRVGDSLVFNYVSGAQNVIQVTGTGYVRCNPNFKLAEYTTSPTTVTLTQPGSYFFISAPLPADCKLNGVKVMVTVV